MTLEELQNQINELEQKFNDFLLVFNNHNHKARDGTLKNNDLLVGSVDLVSGTKTITHPRVSENSKGVACYISSSAFRILQLTCANGSFTITTKNHGETTTAVDDANVAYIIKL